MGRNLLKLGEQELSCDHGVFHGEVMTGAAGGKQRAGGGKFLVGVPDFQQKGEPGEERQDRAEVGVGIGYLTAQLFADSGKLFLVSSP